MLRAALRHGRETGATVLIEATCNQVNHRGGYTGMTPANFAGLVGTLAAVERCPEDMIVLGGDHLGPNPWRELPAEEAMAEAERMVEAYVTAGFRKVHLDASMGCAGEPAALDDATTAHRAARLAAAAERAARATGRDMPVYIIGTEVPPPGGADRALDAITSTAPEAARRTIGVHREVFGGAGLAGAFDRVIGLVVQPGVEFGNRNVILYDRAKAEDLARVLDEQPGLVFEAHSTDYQGERPLSDLVEDGFAILKVGAGAHFRAARGALRARPGRIRAAPRLRRQAADANDGGADARPAERLEPALRRREAESDCYATSHSIASDTTGRRRKPRRPSTGCWRLSTASRSRCRSSGVPARGRRFADTPLDPEEVLISRVRQSLWTYPRACRA